MLKEIVTGVLMCTGGEIPVKSRGLASLGVQSVDKTLCKETVVFNFYTTFKIPNCTRVDFRVKRRFGTCTGHYFVTVCYTFFEKV